MKISDWLQSATKQLESAGIGTARLDALVLAEDATGHDRAYLLAHPDLDVRGLSSHIIEQKIRQRANHEPLAYIRGKTEFYGREFLIDKRVLEPRPESETMIDLLKTYVKGSSPLIVDAGTGSGALAITAKLEIPSAKIIATDIDSGCLAVAKKNARKHSTDISFYQTDLLETLDHTDSDLFVLANLPYVPDDFQINNAAMQEPRLAIFGGHDGLDIYRRLFDQVDQKKLKVRHLFTESMPPQHAKLTELAKQHGYRLQKTDDFIQLFTNNV